MMEQRCHASISSVRAFASQKQYDYSTKRLNTSEFDSTHCLYTRKVIELFAKLRSLPEGDWLLYLDADVSATRLSCEAADLFMKLMPMHARDGSACTFVAQASTPRGRQQPFTVNSGIIAISQVPATRQLLASWKEHQRRKQICFGPADQVALASALLQRYGPFGGGAACEEQLLTTYMRHEHEHKESRDDSLRLTSPRYWTVVKRLKECYSARWHSASITMPLSRDGICLLEASDRLNPRDLMPMHKPEDVFFHSPANKRISATSAGGHCKDRRQHEQSP